MRDLEGDNFLTSESVDEQVLSIIRPRKVEADIVLAIPCGVVELIERLNKGLYCEETIFAGRLKRAVDIPIVGFVAVTAGVSRASETGISCQEACRLVRDAII